MDNIINTSNKFNVLLLLVTDSLFSDAQDDLINKLYQGKLKDYVKCQQV